MKVTYSTLKSGLVKWRVVNEETGKTAIANGMVASGVENNRKRAEKAAGHALRMVSKQTRK